MLKESHAANSAPPPPPRRGRVAAPAASRNDQEQWMQLAAASGRHWGWILIAVIIGVGIGVGIGRRVWSATYTATAQLVRYDTPDPEVFQPRPMNPATLVGIVNSAEVRTRAGQRFEPALTEGEVAGMIRVAPVPSTDLLNVAITASDPAAAAAQANTYAEEAVKFTQEMQARDARSAASYLRHQLQDIDKEVATLHQKLMQVANAPAVPVATVTRSSLRTRQDDARLELADLQARYTDAHPLVQMQLARVAALMRQTNPQGAAIDPTAPAVEPGEAATAPAPAAGDESDEDNFSLVRERARALEARHRDLSGRLQITELLATTPVGHFQMFSPADASRATANAPTVKVVLCAMFFGMCGLIVGLIGSMTEEVFDRRLRTPADVRRVTQLPVLARLGAIDKMSATDRTRWAFRTWTALQSRLSPSPNQGFVVGVTCSTAGEGRSVWIRLLAEAARQCGFSVATITTRPSDSDTDEERNRAARPAPTSATSAVRFRTGKGEPKSAEPVLIHETTLNNELLSDPEEAAEQILANDGNAIVHLPLPGWVWNLEHRKEWLTTLNAWSANENMVVLVELPPASEPESVLLAQNLPNVLWLADATKAEALETRRQVETLRLARCHLVGAVMNRSEGKNLNERFARWMPAPAMAAVAMASLLALAHPVPAHAQDVAGPVAFSVVSPAQRANWQQNLTLGPGDVLRIALFGEPAATRAEVTVQPDGRLSFLEARDVVAQGLTIDEFRQELDRELGNFRRAARTMVSPVAFRSKKYYMLGLVAQRGTFTLDRPMTIVEAVARARGFETESSSGETTELADLRHAFLVRNGQRQPVDFARLFTAGDLSQNIPVEPGDYFFFPPADLQEVFVLGEVRQPGPATLSPESTTLRAVASRGGFTDRAWRDRVLVVRGSLSQPTAFVVNLGDVLAGRVADVPLEPKDIVYVSARPWAKVEELLDEAAMAFVRSYVVYWTSDNVIPITPLPRQ
jgi:protein involved in polysaccharide export with SLBB domain/capsular polysaccharide biosynthesis protein